MNRLLYYNQGLCLIAILLYIQVASYQIDRQVFI